MPPLEETCSSSRHRLVEDPVEGKLQTPITIDKSSFIRWFDQQQKMSVSASFLV